MTFAEFRHKFHPLRAKLHRMRMEPKHRTNTKKVGNGKYYIIRWNDEMHCGWTVWERVALYGCIYAEDHHMIPVMDMQYCHNIYQEKGEYDQVNSWDRYYKQPAGVTVDEALASESYVLADPSQEWFNYIRTRNNKVTENEFLRKKYKQYIQYNDDTQSRVNENFTNLLKEKNITDGSKLLGLCVRGTDYRKYHHMMQPAVKDMLSEVGETVRKLGHDQPL